MKKITIRIIIILIGILLFRTMSVGKPTIYTEIKHDKLQLLNSIEHLKERTRFERMLAMSDSLIAKFIKTISSKIKKTHYDYYYVIDYTIDHYQRNKMLSSMTLNEWYAFKQDKNSWSIMKGASSTLGPYISQDFRIETLEEIEREILTE